eukprot:4110717-Amphidinium_carterae.2
MNKVTSRSNGIALCGCPIFTFSIENVVYPMYTLCGDSWVVICHTALAFSVCLRVALERSWRAFWKWLHSQAVANAPSLHYVVWKFFQGSFQMITVCVLQPVHD